MPSTTRLAPPPAPLRIAIVGGLTRATGVWQRAGDELGVTVEHHDGNIGSARASSLVSLVRRADVVVAITVPNSHNAVAIARRAAASHGRTFVLVKRLRPEGLGDIVADARRHSR